MKLVKTLATYCIIMIFIMTLTSSFLMSSEDVNKVKDLSLSKEKMKEVFYSSATNPDGKNTEATEKKAEAKDKKADEQASEKVTEEKATEDSVYEGLYENKPTVNDAGYALGDSSEEILGYQKLLYYLDYLDVLPEGQIKDVPEGDFESTTEVAVKNYQTAEKLEVTGELNKETQESLLSKPIAFKLGKSGEEVQVYQLILYYLDYLQQYPEGNFENLTETAVKLYQEEKNLEPTGILDQETQKSLKGEKLEYTAGKKGKPITEYQKILIALGYLHGNPDAHLGNVSIEAIKDYQEKNSLEITGYLDIPTQESLNKPLDQQVKF